MSVPTGNLDSDLLCSVIEHVFMPPKLPQKHPGEETERKTNVALCNSLIQAAQDFHKILPSSASPLWMHMIKMMELARRAARSPLKEVDLQRALSDMALGGVFCMHVRAQNAALIVRRLSTADFVQFEVFEVLPLINAVMETEGKLLCSYPGPAIQIPAEIFTDECFLRELSSFLVQMDDDRLRPTPTAGLAYGNAHDGAHPGYISELLVGILRGYGQPAVVGRITKRIGDEVLWDDTPGELAPDERWWNKLLLWRNKQRQERPWRRSPLWLILKVSLQSSLGTSDLYKSFILFFHAYLLRACVRRDFPSELLYVMRIKTARRLSKFGPTISRDIYRFIHDTANETEALLSKRWIIFQDMGSISPTSQLKGLDFAADTQISLDDSYNYLTKNRRTASRGISRSRFTPSHTFRLNEVHDFSQFANGRLAIAISQDPYIAIADFELSVERNLDSWVVASTNNDQSSEAIASCILQYFSGARDLYGSSAEDNSIMILTIMDLWVALDRLATQGCPLLKEYSPEIPSNFLHCLLLHRSSSLRRASHIEEYLCQRHKETLNVPSVFSNSVDDSCFAMKYYRASENLQGIYHAINEHARRKTALKPEEQDSLEKFSESLSGLTSKMDHTYSTDRFGRELHSASCQKCELEHKAQAIYIRIEKSPLPSSNLHAQQMVFELSLPRIFSTWRDITYMIIRDIGMHSVPDSDDRPEIFLDSVPGLKRWAMPDQEFHRVTIASSIASNMNLLSNDVVATSAEEASEFADNQLPFRLFDRIRGSWVIESFSQSRPSELCVPPILKSSPYSHLHPFVSGTEHMPNDIVAAQANCPEEINQQEFVAFSGLRSGARLQWLNIARELASPSLSFGREEVHTLITQAAWQLGPLLNGVREWHIDLSVVSFGNALLCEMECLLEKIKMNRLEEVTVRTIALICSRLFTSTTDPDISRRAHALLRDARNVTYRWIGEIQENLDSIEDETSREGQRLQLCMLAATCFSTLDLGSEHVAGALFSSTDVSIAMQCAVIVHDNLLLSLSDDSPPYYTRLLRRHRRLLHNLEPIFSQPLPTVAGQPGLLHADAYDDALACLRLGYRQGSSNWHVLPGQKSRWVSCMTDEGQAVYYDLLTGELIIGGKPLGRLPREIVRHPAYASLFGTRILDVSPADVRGMEYMARSAESGHQILLSWNNGDLILQARNLWDSRIFQLIPRSVLLGDLPRHVVDEHVHWLDLSTGELEFRPARSPWKSEPSNWRLYIQSSGVLEKLRIPSTHPGAVLQKPSQGDSQSPIQVINIRSNAFAVVSGLLSPLESPENIIVTHTVQSLEVSLPRLHLSFFVNMNRELECRSIPGYVVDTNQSCGAMFGLRNKLVLCPRPSRSEEPLLPRRVIIPQGEISFSTDVNFASVSIHTDYKQHVSWHEYTIDTNLGCLTSNSSLGSKLYQCYLHALTGHCLPDPLLGHTGTEEALYILQGAACRSFQRLDVHEENLLKLIGDLSPDRAFYRYSTAKVKWNDIPILSQHHGFFLAVRTILKHAAALENLYDKPRDFVLDDRHCDQMLINRGASRNRSYYPSDLHISGQPPSSSDAVYSSGDVYDHRRAEDVVYRTSWSILNGRPSVDKELWDVMNSWGSLGPANGEISLRYSRYWLEFNAGRDWFVIYDLCRGAANRNLRSLKIELSFSLSAAAYMDEKYSSIARFLMVFALDERFRNLNHPPDHSYALSDGLVPARARVEDIVSMFILPISTISMYSVRVEGTSIQKVKFWQKREYDSDKYYATIKRESSAVAESILQQWPDYKPVALPEEFFNRSECNRHLKKYLQSISRNIQLREHVRQVQSILMQYGNVLIPTTGPYAFLPQFTPSQLKVPSCALHDILASRSIVPTPSAHGEPFPCNAISPTAANEDITSRASLESLLILIEELQHSPNPFLQLYGNGLNASHHELSGQNGPPLAPGAVPSHEALLLYHHECSHRKDKLFSEISVALAPSQDVEEISNIAGLWPRITPRSILRQLALDHIGTLPDLWKSVIMCYAIFLLKYRQSLRLLELSSRQQREELLLEIEAIHHDILAESTPDWLLVQIEANLVARPVQVTIARKMISPTSKRNTSLQFNMGEGKSSVIVPLVASTLANGSTLTRIVTLKPLSNQMFQLLVSRLSGLANRPIFYAPISRSLPKTPSLVRSLRNLFERCVSEGGVLVVQPEHILSLKLMYIDILLSSHDKAGSIADNQLSFRLKSEVQSDVRLPGPSSKLSTWREGIHPRIRPLAHPSPRNEGGCSIIDEIGALRDWLTNVSRDVLDESDEILHVRYQLVYSSGEQIPVDDNPNRWTTIQQVFGLLQGHVVKLCAGSPKMSALDTTKRGFPIIPPLDSAIIQQISSLIIDDALQGRLSNLPVGVIPSPIQAAARRFISQAEVSDVDHAVIHSHCKGTTFFNGILLLRGLLMDNEGILGYVLKERRWRVDYGLDPSRTLLAVPYRAKDVPSLRAEFAHPDVAITLTCLSYYYGGLTKDQVLMCFYLLSKLDNPAMEYDHWIELAQDLPAALRQLNGVNVEDKTQVDGVLVPLFSRNKGVVDFYLSQVVFPPAARQFQFKLPTSAWDLVPVEHKTNITTGFSGTNDNRHLLPTSITQEDPKFVLGTNALILQHLLRPENDHYECVEGDNGGRESANNFLKRLVKQDPEIRVLLDVGAQLLELQNKELARYWLSLRPDVSAAIFFNNFDYLTVITPDGIVEPLISSPFNRQLEKCVIYLDDAHTRGTDLKLPQGMRAAVTLGPRVTKDRLIQGCMRMRQLGNGHSVMFFAPREVDHRIRRLIPGGIASDGRIRVLDVVRWAIFETCEDICHHLPYWAQQGLDHHKRFGAYEEYRSSGDLAVLRTAWLQSESRTLEQMYWIASDAQVKTEINSIPSLSERMERLGITKLTNTWMAEEQEREVIYEVEPGSTTRRERRPRPPMVQPAQHIIHADILEFIETGKPPRSSMHISPLLAPLKMVKSLESTTEWSPSPLATTDFIRTIVDSDGEGLTEYLRPVNWILSSGSGKKSTIIVISPYEANELLPVIRKSNKVRLHVYAPRVTLSMRSFSDLTFYFIPESPVERWSAPAHVRTELNLFAGQLYFDNRGEYESVCTLLALWMAHPKAEYSEVDGFVPPAYRTGKGSPFARSRIPLLKKLMGLRRKGMGYHMTHMGQILNGKPLGEETVWGLWD